LSKIGKKRFFLTGLQIIIDHILFIDPDIQDIINPEGLPNSSPICGMQLRD
jgi:hypothetical protein